MTFVGVVKQAKPEHGSARIGACSGGMHTNARSEGSCHPAWAALWVLLCMHIRRYGFIDCKETHALYGRDIFVHKDIVGHDVFRALRKGEVVQSS